MTTERLACVTFPDFSYQVVRQESAVLDNRPTVIAERSGDASPLVALNSPAKEALVNFGMTVAQARNRCAELNVIVKDETREAEISGKLLKRLQRVGPFIEESAPGVYYVQASGLFKLYRGESGLAKKIFEELLPEQLPLKTGLASNKLVARIAAGLAGINRYLKVPSGQEREFLNPLEVERLFLPLTGPLKSETVIKLHDLGIHTVGHLAAFPPNEITHRFGDELLALASYARGDDRALLQPEKPTTRLEHRVNLDFPIRAIPQLLTHMEPVLEQALAMLAVSYRGTKEIVWRLKFDNRTETEFRVGLESSGRSKQLFLRQTERLLERVDLSAGVREIIVIIPSISPLVSEQLPLEATGPEQHDGWLNPELNRCQLYRMEPSSGFLPETSYNLTRLDFSKRRQRVTKPQEPELLNPPFASGFMGGLRLVNPPEPISVTREGQQLVNLTFQKRSYRIVDQKGPWKLSGGWQLAETSPGQNFNRLYFELKVSHPREATWSGLVYFDRLRLQWFLQAVFD